MAEKTILGRAGFDAIFGGAPDGVRDIAEALRSRVLAIDPAAAEIAYPGYKTVNYAAAGSEMGKAYCYLMPQKERVNFGFFIGVALSDPHALLEGTGKTLRHIKVASTELACSSRVEAILAQAVEQGRKPALSRG